MCAWLRTNVVESCEGSRCQILVVFDDSRHDNCSLAVRLVARPLPVRDKAEYGPTSYKGVHERAAPPLFIIKYPKNA